MKTIKKFLVFLTTGALSVILAACYGMPVDQAYNHLIRTKDTDNNPIPNLEVEIGYGDPTKMTGRTDSLGEVMMQFPSVDKFKLEISDVDSSQNGGYFENYQVELPDTSEVYDIKLQRRNKK